MKPSSRNRSFFKVVSAIDPSAPTCAPRRSTKSTKKPGGLDKAKRHFIERNWSISLVTKIFRHICKQEPSQIFQLETTRFKCKAMVQEFMILRCFSCTTFQVHQVRIVCIFANSNLLSSRWWIINKIFLMSAVYPPKTSADLSRIPLLILYTSCKLNKRYSSISFLTTQFGCWPAVILDKFIHQSIPPSPSSPPPRLLRGICPPCQSQGWGICKFWLPGRRCNWLMH